MAHIPYSKVLKGDLPKDALLFPATVPSVVWVFLGSLWIWV